MEWEIILSAAFVAIGVIEYLKGFFKTAGSQVWRILQPVMCLLIAGVAAYLPSWVMTGLLALALSQIGYEAIIETVKKKIGGK
jgi:hypothetical protein